LHPDREPLETLEHIRRTIGEYNLKAKGIRYTIVNGGITFEESKCTQVTPGKFLRSYDMVIR
jgi:N-acyl-D-aspartate/D-glutamate deacylase